MGSRQAVVRRMPIRISHARHECPSALAPVPIHVEDTIINAAHAYAWRRRPQELPMHA